ncbi:hypothetical protein [Hymenobacter arizonensis]|uniref:AAA domain-containing protein n=1 Tax=Hymenobacter arizonensis TaxID=1227077 RepID=A0A1I5T8F5_HYMAR|nr:hypothetical protein [Hymenobacter arizonensis]SFP79303.1 hypothetical protein SAMN04515668_0362 [Hymenobacter arizonensis]
MSSAPRFPRSQRPPADATTKATGTPGQLPRIDNPLDALFPVTDAMWASMKHEYTNGREKGQTTHVPFIDKHFTWMPGYTNVITGWPGHGKTELYYQLLLYRAVFAGKKTAIYSPENGRPQDIYDGLIHSLTGRNPDRDWARKLSLKDYALAKDFIREHFVVVSPPRGMGKTPGHILAYFEAAIAHFGVDHSLFDPWNKADHSAQVGMGGIEAYLIGVLDMCTSWAADTRQHLVITAHPKRLEGMAFGNSRAVPDGAAISGGQTWENMALVIGAVHRPNKHIEGDTSVELYWHKVKSHKLVGHPGSVGTIAPGESMPAVLVTFDWKTNRYYFNGWTPFNDPLAYEVWGGTFEEDRPAQRLLSEPVADSTPAPAPTWRSGSQLPQGEESPHQLAAEFTGRGRIVTVAR